MKSIKIIVLLLVMAATSACGEDYLSPELESLINANTFYTTEEQLNGAVINMYDGIQGINSTVSNDYHGMQQEFYLTEMRSDNTRTKSSEGEAAQFENYSIQPTNGIVQDYYNSFYNVIFRANIVLLNLNVASDENKAKIEAEAKFVRAYAYFNLVRLFGDIPLVDQVLDPNDSSYLDVAFTRVNTADIYAFIEEDLENAVAGLDNTYKTRASKAAAQALLAKVYLTQGTNYLEAQILCEEIMSSGFMLQPNFKDVFFNELNSEIIFAIGYFPDSNDSQNFSAEWLNAVGRTSGVNYTTVDSRNALDELGGDRTLYSYRVDTGQPTQFQVVKYLPDGDDDLGIDPTSSDPTSAGNDWIVIRYADVLLMHVEAIMAGGSSTSVQGALDSFEEVRLRAGLSGDDDDNITKQELLDERRVELAYENQRLFDLIRFGEAQNVLSVFSAANGYNFTATDLLLPIPQREINLSNGRLSQNPGYN
ncbi:RagB/SusD family nutrient uptake outer membrane protein [Psychroserpens ponticola]|uniref:RagB/SusD family nutrient uptake outer membrane protein n=1 Tax=Psychroserpens ponticola TaxID=2932268 RepID=A0ABY7RW23_9FLAO|nr:RagB/SusD family nutrient uptake outer membrane protein [Psychroserpens ponticola]WCO00891.1 RagB/SusD family nutrient uptake outer membrane protein [Psychroserpens ponticola]